jgi:hypothetical protein
LKTAVTDRIQRDRSIGTLGTLEAEMAFYRYRIQSTLLWEFVGFWDILLRR